MIQGVLFDMDGVLFDTETYYAQLEHQILREMGHNPPEDLSIRLSGAGPLLVKQILFDLFGAGFDYDYFIATLRESMAEKIRRNGVPKKPGLDELLAYLHTNGYPMAVASSTRIETIRSLLAQAGIEGYFGAVIGGDMVKRSKPEPEIFITAAEALGLSPTVCLAVEDSHNGIRSAAAAGCVTVMVPDLVPATDEMRGLAAAVLPSLAEIPAFIERVNGR